MKAATLDDSVGIFHLSAWKSIMFWVLLTSLLPEGAALQRTDSLTNHTKNNATVDKVKARSTLLETRPRKSKARRRETETRRSETEARRRETEARLREIRTQPGAKKKRSDVAELESKYKTLLQKVSSLETRLVMDCLDAKHFNRSGPVTIYPPDELPQLVSCDQDTDGGGWLVFQRRKYGSVDFYRNWATYAKGFGDINRDFWLGLDTLHMLTSRQRYELRVDLMKFDGTKGYASYSNFSVSDSHDNYRFTYGKFTRGNVGDSLAQHNNRPFTTHDADNDQKTMFNCAVEWKAGWWYSGCFQCHLNGLIKKSRVQGGDAVVWYGFDQWWALKSAEMKMRPEK